MQWNKTSIIKPVEGKIVKTLDSGGNEQQLIYKSGLWWTSDMKMYVYFVPVYWKEI